MDTTASSFTARNNADGDTRFGRPDNRLGPSHPAPLREDKVAAPRRAGRVLAGRSLRKKRAVQTSTGRLRQSGAQPSCDTGRVSPLMHRACRLFPHHSNQTA